MEDRIFDILFDYEGKQYTGWANPSEKTRDNGAPVSFHVVLGDVYFANLSISDDKWVADEARPAGLIEAAGNAIQETFRKNGAV